MDRRPGQLLHHADERDGQPGRHKDGRLGCRHPRRGRHRTRRCGLLEADSLPRPEVPIPDGEPAPRRGTDGAPEGDSGHERGRSDRRALRDPRPRRDPREHGPDGRARRALHGRRGDADHVRCERLHGPRRGHPAIPVGLPERRNVGHRLGRISDLPAPDVRGRHHRHGDHGGLRRRAHRKRDRRVCDRERAATDSVRINHRCE